jgi:hypothetical protein
MSGNSGTEPLDGPLMYEKRYIACTYCTYSLGLIQSFNNRFKNKQMLCYGLVGPPHHSLQPCRDGRTDPFVRLNRVSLSLELPSKGLPV